MLSIVVYYYVDVQCCVNLIKLYFMSIIKNQKSKILKWDLADVTESSAPIYICTDNACIDGFGFKKYEHFDNNHTDNDRE